MKKIISLIMFTVCFIQFNSCKISGSFAGLSSRFQTNFNENPELYKFLSPNDRIQKDYKHAVLVITDSNLLQEIKNENKVLIYRWSPHCKSDICYPLKTIYYKCENNKIDFYPVSEYYDNDLMKVNLNDNYPILVPNTNHYQTNNTKVYLSKFYSNIGQKNYDTCRFYYFRNGELISNFKNINYIDSLQ